MAPIIEEMKRKRILAKNIISILTTYKAFMKTMEHFRDRIVKRDEASLKMRVALRIIRLFNHSQKRLGANVKLRIQKQIRK